MTWHHMAIGGFLGQLYSALMSLITVQFVGLLISALLAIFAYRQTKINQDQKELVEFQHTSFPTLEDWDIIGSGEYFEYTNDRDYLLTAFTSQIEFVEVELSNIGQAPAIDLRCQVQIMGDELGWETDGALSRGGWRELSDRIHDHSIHSLGLNPGGAAIGAEEKRERFTTAIATTREDLEEAFEQELECREYLTPTSLCRLLYEEGEDSLTIGVSLWFSDGTGERDPIYLSYTEVSESGFVDFEYSLKNGKPLMPDEVPHVERWWS